VIPMHLKIWEPLVWSGNEFIKCQQRPVIFQMDLITFQ
jgi:hypothetical protein